MKKIFFILIVSFLLSSPCLAGEWNLTGSLNQGREDFCSVILNDGRVLIAGGIANCITLSSCEIYNPNTGEWILTDSMNYARHHFSLTKLSEGKILATAGCTTIGGPTYITSEIFDPETETWNQIATLNYGRDSHATILLQNGNVLVVGGDYANDYMGCEVYDPNTHQWLLTGFCSWPKVNHTLELLPDGHVMSIAGGSSVFNKAELYDPSSGEWTELSSLSDHRKKHTSHLLLLPNGDVRVMVIGGSGYNGSPQFLASCEIYDFQTEEWTFTDSLEIGRTGHCSESLLNNKILAIGGQGETGSGSGHSCEIYNSTTNQWQIAASLYHSYGNFSSEILFDERVLAIRSWCEIYTWNYMPIAQLQGPTQGTIGEELTFSVTATDPDNDSISIRIDWGDDEFSQWTDLQPSGHTFELSHSYSQYGNYEIKVQVSDQWFFQNELCHNSLSEWSQPFTILISGIPQISTLTEPLDFGFVYIGEDSVKTVTISNLGDGILSVELSTNTSIFSVWPESFDLEPEEALDVEVTFTPSYEGTIADTLTILSNDLINPEIQIELIGEGKVLTGVNENLISTSSLQIYPNPFNSETTISFSSDEVGPHQTEILIFNIKGQIVKTWALQTTSQQVVWNGKDETGKAVAGGIYFCKYRIGRYSSTKKIILLK